MIYLINYDHFIKICFHVFFIFSWVTRLLVTPSKLLLQTAGVLIGTCLLIAGLILILHIKEKVSRTLNFKTFFHFCDTNSSMEKKQNLVIIHNACY